MYESEPPQQFSRVAPRFEGRCALIIDDSKLQRRILRKILTDLGFSEVFTAEGHADAFAAAADHAIDLVLCDWHLPEVRGAQLVTALREMLPDANLIVVSAETDLQIAEQALGAGADEYVMKPVASDVVREKLALLDER